MLKWPGKNANFQKIFISADPLGSKTQGNVWNEIQKNFVNILGDPLSKLIIILINMREKEWIYFNDSDSADVIDIKSFVGIFMVPRKKQWFWFEILIRPAHFKTPVI